MWMIDCHCHLTDPRCYVDADRIISEGVLSETSRFVLGGTDPEEWDRQAALSVRHPGRIIQNYGLHPWQIEKLSRLQIESALAVLGSRLADANGLGETGLDFFDKRDASRFDDQRFAFLHQLKLAVSLRKPIVLHVVKAFDEVLRAIQSCVLGANGGVTVPIMLHRFSGSREQAEWFLRIGAHLSFSPAILDAERGKKTRLALEATPIERILIETDGPDYPFDQLRATYVEAAKIKRVSPSELTLKVEQNLKHFYSI